MSDHLIVMDDEYAKLSLLTGMFVAAADAFLGRRHFEAVTRPHVWSLTWDKLAAWKAEAIRMGVPAKMLELTAKERAMMPQRIKEGRRWQDAVDRANPSGIVH